MVINVAYVKHEYSRIITNTRSYKEVLTIWGWSVIWDNAACFFETQTFHLNRNLNEGNINLLTPTGHVMHQQFSIQQLYVLPTLYLCVLYLSENKQRLVPLTV
jgi:hypothetical protein